MLDAKAPVFSAAWSWDFSDFDPRTRLETSFGGHKPQNQPLDHPKPQFPQASKSNKEAQRSAGKAITLKPLLQR
jgi:hypothetical protein